MSYAVGRISKTTVALGSSGGGLSVQVALQRLAGSHAVCTDNDCNVLD